MAELTVRFEKAADAPVCRVVARRRTGRPLPVSSMGGATRLPHDLATFVVERELGLRGGFFNLTAHGAIFRSSRRRMTRPGRALILDHRAELDDAERAVNAAHAEWRAGRHTAVTAVLADADRAWAALAPGAALELTWPILPLPRPGVTSADRGARRGARRGRPTGVRHRRGGRASAGQVGVISCQPRGSMVQTRRVTGPRTSPSAL
jgi:hypothetical protein